MRNPAPRQADKRDRKLPLPGVRLGLAYWLLVWSIPSKQGTQ